MRGRGRVRLSVRGEGVGLGMRVEGKVLHREVRAEGAVERGELAHLQGSGSG